ncbi:type 2 lantipeptide synthetase LanM family protein [Chitinophaga pendula]|uniref:type 2 lanthipeptide synthetase LanM family protein n=1 Tax=Chitinophaga TaxID=79328 RepID=UPI000BB0110A|nr:MULTISPECIES: type 2 lanthipeptide synthetase LanM family protein [Chitinophaga]ASZ11867.1 hypothetical protein CK934_13315 [Chitinophaga sp. MD30]UCJ05108.1 type 2 lantipeptide synthetase LanM family protein [Chitinophaga pendula]
MMTVDTELSPALLLNGLYLYERIQLVTSNAALRNALVTLSSSPAAIQAYQRLITQPPYNEPVYLDEWLTSRQISRDELAAVCTEEFPALVSQLDIPLPDWTSSIIRLYNTYDQSNSSFATLITGQIPLAGFFNVADPIIIPYVTKLTNALRQYTAHQKKGPFELERIIPQLLNEIAVSVFEMVDRTLVLELNVARVKNELQGNTPGERFESFIHLLSTPEKRNTLVAEYPVLFRCIYEYMQRWELNCFTLLQRLNDDWQDIRQHFDIAGDDKITGLRMNAGDRHNGGQTVVIYTFTSGKRLVYKPRSLSLDGHFQQLLQWFNSKQLQPAFKLLKVLDKQQYGWMEFISYHPCRTTTDVQEFYTRIGYLLAVLYAINATDFHYENIIANGPHPMLIDLESLFHPDPLPVEDTLDGNVTGKIRQSVLNIHLLPFKMYVEEGVIDMSGITNIDGREIPKPVPTWENTATDHMRSGKRQAQFKAGTNIPRFNEQLVQPLEYADIINNAFRHCYQLIKEHRDELLNTTSLLPTCFDTHVRILLRPTAAYSQLLKTAFHPDHLRNALEQDALFNLLWQSEPRTNAYRHIVPAEITALQNRDVPFFNAIPSEKNIYSANKLTTTSFFSNSGQQEVTDKLRQLSTTDMEQQCWFIRAALASSTARHADTIQYAYKKRYHIIPAVGSPDKNALINAACAIGERLAELAITQDDNAQWVSLIAVDNDNFDVKPLQTDLYSGLPGVALFLGALYHETKQAAFKELADRCVNKMLQISDHLLQASFTQNMGAFDGCAGIAYSCYHLSYFMQQPSLQEHAMKCARFIVDHCEEIIDHDIISGAAGIICALKILYLQQQEESLLATMTKLGDKIIADAEQLEQGIGWRNNITGNVLGGLGHGAAGIALALSELYGLTGMEKYKHHAIAALEFENSLFMPSIGNWMDKRQVRNQELSHQEHYHMIAWCHGAAGIGLSRIKIHRHLPLESITKDIRVAIATTRESGLGTNQSICHGDMGNLELLLSAALHFDDQVLLTDTYRMVTTLLQQTGRDGYTCGVALGVENPGFMLGLSGIGYQLLRFARPDIYKAVALLD